MKTFKKLIAAVIISFGSAGLMMWMRLPDFVVGYISAAVYCIVFPFPRNN